MRAALSRYSAGDNCSVEDDSRAGDRAIVGYVSLGNIRATLGPCKMKLLDALKFGHGQVTATRLWRLRSLRAGVRSGKEQGREKWGARMFLLQKLGSLDKTLDPEVFKSFV